MRYVVVGAGAVGGVIGARLALGGVDVTLVARGAHLEAIRAGGLVLETPVGRDVAHPVTVGSPADVAWAEDHVVLLAVKSQQTAAALDDLAAVAPAGIPVVSVQNGVANERALLRRFARTYGICVMQPCAHLEPGVVVQQCHPVPGLLDIGRYPSGVDEVCTGVAADLESAGFESVPRPDIMAWKHRKLVMNLGNVVDACFAPSPAADTLLELARAEGEAALAAAGIDVISEEQDRERRGDLLRGRARADAHGSTWQSLARGTGDVETHLLNGEVVLLGRLHGVPVPANEALQRVGAEAARGGLPPGSLDAGDVLTGLP